MADGRSFSNPLALAVLSCLYEQPMHPYEMAQTLRSRGKHESVKLNYGSLYSVVESLEKHGAIRARETVREGRRPERTIYEITDMGTEKLVGWLAQLVSTPGKEYPQFQAALSFLPVLPPDEAARLLRQRCMALERRLAEGRAALATLAPLELPRLFLIDNEYEQRLLEAELDWVTLLTKEIESGSLEGMDQWAGFHDTTT